MFDFSVPDSGSMQSMYGVKSFDATSLDRLNKALLTSNGGNGQPGDGSGLIPQSLARTLKIVTYEMNQLKLWRMVDKQEAYAVNEQYDQILDYGGQAGIFVAENTQPPVQDSTFKLNTVAMKYMATTFSTSLAMMAVESVPGDVETLQTENATKWLLGGVERQLFYADSSLDGAMFDGVRRIITSQATSSQIIDAGGQPLTPEVLENAAEIITEAYGDVEQCKVFMSPKVKSDFSKGYFPNQRVNLSELAKGQLVAGSPMRGYDSSQGFMDFIQDNFLNLQKAPTAASSGAPAAPASITAVSGTQAGSQFQTAPSASYYGVQKYGGVFYYTLTAHNASGTSVLGTAPASVTVAAGQGVTVGWNRVTTNPAATYYTIWRSLDGTNWSYLTRVADAGSGTTQSYIDLNADVAGTYDVFVLNMNSYDGLVFKQLLPFFKWPLGNVVLGKWFSVALFGAPIIYVPTRCVLIKNVGAASSVNPASAA